RRPPLEAARDLQSQRSADGLAATRGGPHRVSSELPVSPGLAGQSALRSPAPVGGVAHRVRGRSVRQVRGAELHEPSVHFLADRSLLSASWRSRGHRQAEPSVVHLYSTYTPHEELYRPISCPTK